MGCATTEKELYIGQIKDRFYGQPERAPVDRDTRESHRAHVFLSAAFAVSEYSSLFQVASLLR